MSIGAQSIEDAICLFVAAHISTFVVCQALLSQKGDKC